MRPSFRLPDSDFLLLTAGRWTSVGPYQLFMAVGVERLQPHHVNGQKSGSNFITIHELLKYSSRIVTVAFVYDKSRQEKANQAFWNTRVIQTT